MRTMLAAIDDDSAAPVVLATARALAERTGAEVRALHVADQAPKEMVEMVASAGLQFTTVTGEPQDAICQALEDDALLCAVLGLGAQSLGPQPAGSITTAVCEACPKPVIVVPRDFRLQPNESFNRALVPLDGTEVSAGELGQAWDILEGSGIAIVALHVFDRKTIPRFWDATRGDIVDWSQAFLLQNVGLFDAKLEVRRGSPSERILEVAQAAKADLIVLEWAQTFEAGHGDVVRQVLSHTTVPVLLLPVRDETDLEEP